MSSVRTGGSDRPDAGTNSSGSGGNSWDIQPVPNEVLQYVQYMTSLLLAHPHRLTGQSASQSYDRSIARHDTASAWHYTAGLYYMI